MKNKKKRNIIPVGIFTITLLILLIISSIMIGGYFYFTTKKRIIETENYTRNYSILVIEAFVRVAELCYKTRNYSKLRILFQEKIDKNIIDEAFFVLHDGKIITHSNKTISKSLNGNIVNDEFAYNIDLILMPLKSKIWGTRFLDYYIIDKKVPFKKRITKLIKKYIYKKIDMAGWLTTKAVIVKGRAVGSVNLIISKDRIYNILQQHIKESRRISIIMIFTAFIVSIFISTIVFFRYRNLNRISSKEDMLDIKNLYRMRDKEFFPQRDIITRNDKETPIEDGITPGIVKVFDESALLNLNRTIKDAIPISNN